MTGQCGRAGREPEGPRDRCGGDVRLRPGAAPETPRALRRTDAEQRLRRIPARPCRHAPPTPGRPDPTEGPPRARHHARHPEPGFGDERRHRRVGRGRDPEPTTERPRKPVPASGFRAAWRAAPGATLALGFSVPAASAAALLLPAAASGAVDTLLDGGGTARAMLPLAGVLLLGLVAGLVGELAGPGLTAALTARLRRRIAEHTVALGTGGRNPYPAGDITGRLVGSAPDAARLVPASIRTIGALATSLGGIVALGLLDPWLAVAFVGGLLPGLVVVRAFMADATHLFERYQEIQARISARLADALAGLRTIRACGTRDREHDRVLGPLTELSTVGHGLWHAQRRAVARVLLLAPVVEIAVLSVAGWGLSEGRIPRAAWWQPRDTRHWGWASWSSWRAWSVSHMPVRGCGRTEELFGVPAAPHGAKRVLPTGSGELVFRGVTVRDRGRLLLDRVDLTVPAGACCAVVGASGSGKSLLAALPGRLRDPDAGSVAIDGLPVAALARGELRRAVAYAFPRPTLLGHDVREAIGFGKPGAEASALVHAAAVAHADDFVRRLPDGYGTRIDGLGLSGGEVQRLGLARAVAQDARVIVLDDATSGLDMVTEHQVMDAFARRLGGRTRVVVAYRATAAASADLVVWLDRGRVRAVGTHDDLWDDADYRAVFAGVPRDPPRAARGTPRRRPTPVACVRAGPCSPPNCDRASPRWSGSWAGR
ncbi:ATP-binding cassette domain-containing protein [Yinghuangia aomiensis]